VIDVARRLFESPFSDDQTSILGFIRADRAGAPSEHRVRRNCAKIEHSQVPVRYRLLIAWRGLTWACAAA
jgi:hypothetical protein